MRELLKTKIFWFNLLTLLVVVANAFGFQEFVPSDEVEQIAVVVVIVINLISRYLLQKNLRNNNDNK